MELLLLESKASEKYHHQQKGVPMDIITLFIFPVVLPQAIAHAHFPQTTVSRRATE